MMRVLAAAGALLLLGAAPAEPPPNPQVVGERVFLKCYSCHTIRPGTAPLSGPSLHGIIGRKTAAQPGFDYSPAMRTFSAKHPVWTFELLDRYAADPQTLVPGTTMTSPGVSDPEERAELMDYLRAKSD